MAIYTSAYMPLLLCSIKKENKMNGGTGPYVEILIMSICLNLMNPILLTILFKDFFTNNITSKVLRIIILILFFLIIAFISKFLFLLMPLITLIPFLIISISSTVLLIYLVDLKNRNE